MGRWYRSELDLVVTAPDGSFAAYCIAWYDAANRIGVFEPVGCHPAHRRQGLTKVLLFEGMRRLAGLGARAAFVGTNGTNVAAAALYSSVGFQLLDRKCVWEKEVAA